MVQLRKKKKKHLEMLYTGIRFRFVWALESYDVKMWKLYKPMNKVCDL